MTYKSVMSADEATALIPSGATVMMGGFGLCGIPEHLSGALARRKTGDLTWGSVVINGREHVCERALPADFAFVKAWKADRAGNLVYRRTARNFNPIMATAAEVTVAEVEEIVEPGDIDPDHIVTPGIFVKHLVQGGSYEKRIEKRTVRQ